MQIHAWEGLGLAERDDDKLLLAGFVGGDHDAFERLVALYEPRVSRLAWRLLGWSGDIDDVVQEVFLAALTQCHKFRGEAGLWPWLTAITVNRCRSRMRRNFLRLRWLRDRTGAEPSDAPAADRDVLRDETCSRVRAAVRALPPRDREVIVLYYLEDRSVAEISGLTRRSENAIDVRLHRARKRLKEILGTFASP